MAKNCRGIALIGKDECTQAYLLVTNVELIRGAKEQANELRPDKITKENQQVNKESHLKMRALLYTYSLGLF
jgi:hypothetical protein